MSALALVSVVNFPLDTESWRWGSVESPLAPRQPPPDAEAGQRRCWAPGTSLRGNGKLGSTCWVHTQRAWLVLRVRRGEVRAARGQGFDLLTLAEKCSTLELTSHWNTVPWFSWPWDMSFQPFPRKRHLLHFIWLFRVKGHVPVSSAPCTVTSRMLSTSGCSCRNALNWLTAFLTKIATTENVLPKMSLILVSQNSVIWFLKSWAQSY